MMPALQGRLSHSDAGGLPATVIVLVTDDGCGRLTPVGPGLPELEEGA